MPGNIPLFNSHTRPVLDPHNMPPLNPLRTFEVAARRGSFTDAAVELNVTQAAVSRQISVLEQFFQLKLFVREARAVRLTQIGKRLFEEIRPAFEILGWTTYNILRKRDGNIVTIQTYPTLVATRLLPKLPDFQARNQDICLNFQSEFVRGSFVEDNSDIMIKSASELPDDMDGFLFGSVEIAPAVSPALFSRSGKSAKRLLAEQTILTSKHCQADWIDWAADANVDITSARQITFDNSLYAYGAARDGVGVCIAELYLIADELNAGRLMLPFKHVLKRQSRYWCMWRKHHRNAAQVTRTLKWLESIAEQPRAA
jgi:LysR family glycine cleavage system transcriptional activator